MDVLILTVGTELLLGDTLDTNSYYLSKKIRNLGFNLYKKVTVGDNTERLLKELRYYKDKYDLIITTGGLGPTKDDLTKETAIKALELEDEVEIHKSSLETVKEHFKGREEYLDLNMKQVMFPKNSIVLKNIKGTAPGALLIGKQNEKIAVLPGPPEEMKTMFENELEPILKKYSDSIIYSETVHIARLGESKVFDMISELFDKYTNPTIAPYFNDDGVFIRITAKASSEIEAKKIIKPVKEELYSILGDLIYGENGQSIEEVVKDLLEKEDITLMTAESITGGMIVSRLIDIAGMSEFIKESLVVYSDEAKVKYLGVSEQTIEKHTVVSEEVCKEMVEGLLKTYNCNLAVATTGYAGPDDEKAGLVYVGIGYKGKNYIKEYNIKGDRNTVRRKATRYAIENIRFAILDSRK